MFSSLWEYFQREGQLQSLALEVHHLFAAGYQQLPRKLSDQYSFSVKFSRWMSINEYHNQTIIFLNHLEILLHSCTFFSIPVTSTSLTYVIKNSHKIHYEFIALLWVVALPSQNFSSSHLYSIISSSG